MNGGSSCDISFFPQQEDVKQKSESVEIYQ